MELTLFILVITALSIAIFKKPKAEDVVAPILFDPKPQTPSEAVFAPQSPVTAPQAPILEELKWGTPREAFHSLRVMCDRAGLTVDQKNKLSACVFQESRFDNTAVCYNKDKATGEVWSRDIGIFQVNTYFHVGKGKRYPNEAYVLAHPEKPADWMIETMKSTGKLQPWASWTSGAYKQWLVPTSPMWALKS